MSTTEVTSQTPRTLAAKGYVAGVVAYRYPALGDAKPPGGAKVLLLTRGLMCVTGAWSDSGGFLAWSPMPEREAFRVPATGTLERAPSGDVLLLSCGGICIFGTWVGDGRYQGWAPMPERDRAKEESLKVLAWRH
jgi:hypothetical protein